MAYVKNRHIGEGGRLMSDIIEIARLKKLGIFLVTMDIEQAFDSLDHNFVISTLEKYGFGKKFILWVKILLRDQEPCVINSGTITKYFSLGRDARQGDPILFTGFKNFKNKYINKCGGVVIRYLHETFELCLQHIQLIFNSKGDKY